MGEAGHLDILYQFQKEGHLCDATLTSSDGDEFVAHAGVLAAAIPAIEEKLAKCQRGVYYIETSLAGEEILNLIHYAYTGVHYAGEIISRFVTDATVTSHRRNVLAKLHQFAMRGMLCNTVHYSTEYGVQPCQSYMLAAAYRFTSPYLVTSSFNVLSSSHGMDLHSCLSLHEVCIDSTQPPHSVNTPNSITGTSSESYNIKRNNQQSSSVMGPVDVCSMPDSSNHNDMNKMDTQSTQACNLNPKLKRHLDISSSQAPTVSKPDGQTCVPTSFKVCITNVKMQRSGTNILYNLIFGTSDLRLNNSLRQDLNHVNQSDASTVESIRHDHGYHSHTLWFTCAHCSKTITDVDTLQQHKCTSALDQLYKCERCGQGAIQTKDCNQHFPHMQSRKFSYHHHEHSYSRDSKLQHDRTIPEEHVDSSSRHVSEDLSCTPERKLRRNDNKKANKYDNKKANKQCNTNMKLSERIQRRYAGKTNKEANEQRTPNMEPPVPLYRKYASEQLPQTPEGNSCTSCCVETA